MLSKAGGDKDPEKDLRREIIRGTYRQALEEGDRHIWFADGNTFFGTNDRDLCTVDGVHPTDIGFVRMADALEPLLRKILYG